MKPALDLIKHQPPQQSLPLLGSPLRSLSSLVLGGSLLIASLESEQVYGQGVPRAVPVEENVPRAQPVEESQPRQGNPAPTPAPSAPKIVGPDETLYEYATLCFAQKDYNIAIKPLSEYVRLYPQGRHADEAWFRLGECHHETGDTAAARRAYNEVLNRHSKSDSAPSAAYRMGTYAYNAKDFVNAGDFFSVCGRLTPAGSKLKLPALYNSAISYEQGADQKKALAAFTLVSAIKEENKYRETALIKVADAALKDDKKEQALAAFQDIIAITKDEQVLGDALLRSGLLLNEQGKTDEATKNFKRVLTLHTVPREQRGMALFGIVQSAYIKKDYDTVISTYTSNATTLPPGDIHAKMLLIVGNAQKQKQNYRQAIETFLLLEKNHPDAPEAIDAGYQKLLSFYQLGDPDIPKFSEAFEATYRKQHADHEYLTMSRLIRADWWFGKGDYAKAAEAFGGLNIGQLPDKVLPSVLFKKGFTEVEAGKNTEAISSLTSYLTKFPDDSNVPSGLAQRGIAYKNVRTFDKALADFDEIVKKHNGSPALEMALYQSGFIKGETRDFQGMVASYEQLLQKFPKTAAAAEVSYAIGRGYFNLNAKDAFGKALEPLRRSIALDSATYLDKSSQLLINCQWLRDDLDGTAKEVETYLAARNGATINPQILIYLGANYFNRGNYDASNKYLTLASTPGQPDNTDPLVWSFLGRARNELGYYAAAVDPFDNFLAKTPSGQARVEGLYGKGRAMLGIANFHEAEEATGEALNLLKTGMLKGKLQILEGDIQAARGDALAKSGSMDQAKIAWGKALAQYVVVSQLFVDPVITPEAATKAAEMFDKTGDPKQATGMRQQVKAKYPDYAAKPPAPPRHLDLPKEEPPPAAVDAVPGAPVPDDKKGEPAAAESIPKAEPVPDDEAKPGESTTSVPAAKPASAERPASEEPV